MDDLIRREDAFSYFVTLWECIGTIMDKNEWEDVCMTTANEIPSAQPEIKTDVDTISRQAAIDLWEKYHPTIAVDAMQYDAELRQLPSAQPVLTCKGCKYDYYEYAGCRNCLRKERELYEPE